jgi:hypothetical protein
MSERRLKLSLPRASGLAKDTGLCPEYINRIPIQLRPTIAGVNGCRASNILMSSPQIE